MRSALFVAVASCAACKGDPVRHDASDNIIDAYKPPWFFPAPGEVKDWDIQLGGYDLSQTRAMMVVDVWDVVPAPRTITYADATTVDVPAGAQPGAIAQLKAAGTTVICHVGLGAVRLGDPDATKLPGYEASPPNRPDPVAANSAIGWSTTAADANERFVDFRNTTAAAVLKKRVQLAKDIGCDGIAAYRMDAFAFVAPASTLEHGFAEISPAQQTQWIADVAKVGHDVMMSVGGRGMAAQTVSEIVDDFDWVVIERCGEFDDCDTVRPFIEAKRAVFGLDYDLQEDGTTPNPLSTICPRWANAQVDGVQKTAALDGSFRMVCP